MKSSKIFKNKWFQTLAIFALSLFFLVACGNTDSEGDSETETESSNQTSDAASETAEDTEDGEENIVRIAIVTEIDSLDPHQSAASDTGAMLANIHDGLVDTNAAGEVIPNLAESYEISDDNLVYTFNLVENATFHNGDPVTADDVVYSYVPLAGLNGEEGTSSKWEVVTNIEAIDEHTVEITLENIDSGFVPRTMSPIMPEGYEDQETQPIGAGPFKFEDRVTGQSLTMSRFDDYYMEDKVAEIEGVEWRLIQDQATVNIALQTGEIDIGGVNVSGKEELGDAVNYLEGPQNMPVIFGLNHEHEPFQDERVRQAINHAINKEEIINTVHQGNAVALGSNFSPVMEFYFQDGLVDTWPHDVARAEELLVEAGYENLEFTIKVPTHAQFYSDIAQVMQNQLAEAGITMTIEPIEWNSWLEEVYTDFNHEATIVGLTGKVDPYDVLIRFVDGYNRNFINLDNDDYNEAIANAVNELDDDARADYYKEAQTILAEEAASVFLVDPNRIVAVNPKYEGLELFPIVKYNFEDIRVVE